ncbi:hypothetical protein [Kibdelosporangium persicum]|nr:hypothetical protein [Kibdelosporangium persicum]
MPAIALPPGRRLRTDIEAALRNLENVSPEDSAAVGKVHDDLRGALAHTAAIGETSQVFTSVNAVRIAEQCLRACLLTQARAALAEALRALPADPV